MTTKTILEAHTVGIGIDVSKNKLDLALRMSNFNYLESSFSNDANGIKSLCLFMKHQEAANTAPLVIESTGDYHLQSALIIKQKEYNVKLINPVTTKKYQQSSIRNAKTDKIDAKRLADIAVLEQDLPDFKDNIEQIRSRKLVAMLAHLEKTKQQMTLSLKRFKETAKIIKIKHSISHFEKAIDEIDKQIKLTRQTLVDSTPQQVRQLAEQTKGLSQEKLAIIHTLISNKTFSNHDQLVAFFGLDIAVRQSGTWCGKSKLSKRGNSYARKILYQIAWGLKMHNETFKECYIKHRQGNKHYNTIMMILARKFLRYYFSYTFKRTATI